MSRSSYAQSKRASNVEFVEALRELLGLSALTQAGEPNAGKRAKMSGRMMERPGFTSGMVGPGRGSILGQGRGIL